MYSFINIITTQNFLVFFEFMGEKEKTLLELCQNEEWDEIEKSISEKIEGWNLIGTDYTGDAPLFILAREGKLSIIEAIHAKKNFFPLPKHLNTLTNEACKSGNVDLVLWCIEHECASLNGTIVTAIEFGHLDIVKLLFSKGRKFDERNSLGYSCILIAAKHGNLDILKYIHQNGGSLDDVTDNRENCILLASLYGHLDMVKWLSQNGNSIHSVDIGNYSCVLSAACQGKLEVINWLIENGCSLDEINNFGETCITIASREGYIDLIQWLIEKGQSLSTCSKDGTCIIEAAKNNRIDLVIWMLNNGSSIDENSYRSEDGDINTGPSCEKILKDNGTYEIVKKAMTTKSSRK